MVRLKLGVLVAASVAVLAACGASEPAKERSPETKIAFTASLRGFPGTWVVASDGSGLAKLSAPYTRTRRTELRPVWSPDGRRIAFLAYLEKDALSGGAEYHVYVMDANGGRVRNLTAGRLAAPGNFDWSPDGKRLVVDAFNERNDKTRIHVLRVDGERVTRLTGGNDFSPRWSPDGSTIAFSRFGHGEVPGLYAIAPNGTRLRRLDARASTASWSPDGSRVAYFRGIRPFKIYLIKPDGSGRAKLTEQLGDAVGDLVWSPDGRKIVYAAHRRRRGWDIYVVGADGSGRRRLTSDGGDEVSPVWSPDGARIAYERSDVSGLTDNTGTYDVYLMNADGADKRRLTNCRCVAGGGLSWQPQRPDR